MKLGRSTAPGYSSTVLKKQSRQSRCFVFYRPQPGNGFQLVAIRRFQIPKINGLLGVEPEPGGIAEKPGKAQCHQRRDRPTTADQLVDGLARDPEGCSQGRGAQSVIGHKVFPKHLAGMSWGNGAGKCDVHVWLVNCHVTRVNCRQLRMVSHSFHGRSKMIRSHTWDTYCPTSFAINGPGEVVR